MSKPLWQEAAGLTFVRPESVYGAPANDALQLGVIGCGGRGHNDSREFVQTTNTRVIALADPFQDRLESLQNDLNRRLEAVNRPPVESSMLFQGMDAYRKLLDAPVDVVLITSPPYYHPEHLMATVEAGKHVYCEKPVGVDVPGCLKVIEAGKKAEGKCSVMVGFQIRESEGFKGVVNRVHDGAIGDIVFGQVYYHSGRLSPHTREGASEDENRLRNWVFDKVLSGDIIVEQNIHVIDVANWYLQEYPVKAYGTGGRKARTDVGDTWDHYVVTYYYPNDIRVDFSSSQFLVGWGDCRERFLNQRNSRHTL